VDKLWLGRVEHHSNRLPGSSSQTKETVKAARAAQCASQEVSQSQIQINPHVVIQTDPLDNELYYVLANEVGDSDALVREFDDPKLADDDNLQIFIGSGGGWLGVGVLLKFSADKMKSLEVVRRTRRAPRKIVPDSPAPSGPERKRRVLEINGGSASKARSISPHDPRDSCGPHGEPDRMARRQLPEHQGHGRKQEAGDRKMFVDGPKSFAFKMPTMPAMPDLSGLEHLRTFSMISPDVQYLELMRKIWKVTLAITLAHPMAKASGARRILRTQWRQKPAEGGRCDHQPERRTHPQRQRAARKVDDQPRSEEHQALAFSGTRARSH